ncbi:DUF2625 family protein [Streptomyces sp. NPDC006992]|uniref:DUF2625 family protein n=1 Tax=Streptomyces sp. NPDC006992 TaxID=3155601 RepID=UPI0033FB0308
MPSVLDPARRPDPGLVVAHHLLGRILALNGGSPREAGRPGEPGETVYFAPDSLSGSRWRGPLSMALVDSLRGLGRFHEGLRWTGWRGEVSAPKSRQGLSFFPPPWSAEARRRALSETSRRAGAMAELLGLSRNSHLLLDGVDPGRLGVARRLFSPIADSE